MAVSEFYRNMYDIRLKPRLLKSLIQDRLPDEKHPFPSYFELSSVISSLKIHGLLSESFPESTVDPKLAESWKSAVDAWVDRLLSLASSKMPDKCWAGIGLLGVTFQECSSDRFLASYSVWFQKLLPQIQLPSDSNFVKVASCTSLSDMFTRLGGFSNVKKDGTSQAGKLVQPLLKLLSEDGSEVVLERATDLLCTLITFFPSSVHRHYDNAESVIVSKIMSGKCSATMSKKLAQSLALLPKARADGDSWSLMMQKVLISVNMNLNDAFQGLEEETKSHETIRLLIPPGKDLPPPLGGQSVLGEVSVPATKLFGQLLIPRVSTLMHCVCLMLTNPYPVQVTVPVRPLLALVQRILAVDGSLSEALQPFMTVIQQEFICSELPLLHLCSLDLLIAVIKGVRSQLLPYAAEVVRLLTEYFRRCVLPSIRIKVYSIMKILLITMGVGITLYLAEEVISNAFADLNFITHGSGLASSVSYPSKMGMEALLQPSLKKRKHISGSPGDNRNGVRHEGEVHQLPHKKAMTPISVQIAALQALEALVTVGGALRSEWWRLEVDRLLITVATNICDGGWSSEERNIASDELTPNRANFQLTALRALLASLLSPGCTRPPYFSQGLELFRRGKQEVGTKLAEFCAHALLTLEVLIHPRTLPLLDFPSGNHSKADGVNLMFPSIALPSRGIPAVDDFDPDDDLCDSWLGNGEETGPPSSDLSKKQIEKASEQIKQDDRPVINDPMSAKLSGNVLAGCQAATIEEIPVPTSDVHVDMGGKTDENMVESEPLEVPFSHNGTGGWVHNQMTSSEVLLSSNEMTSTKGVSSLVEPKRCSFVSSVVLSPDSGKEKGVVFSADSDADSLDSLPDIVVGDPDSD